MSSKSKGKANDDVGMVLEYMKKINRPINLNDLVNNMQGKLGKSGIQKALVTLVKDEEVVEKMYGKQSIFCVDQEKIEVPGIEIAEEQEQEIVELEEKIKIIKGEISGKAGKLQGIKKVRTVPEINERIAYLKQQNEMNRERIEKLNKGEIITDEEKKKINEEYEAMNKAKNQRKRMFKNMFDLIAENYPGKPQKLKEEMGIEEVEE